MNPKAKTFIYNLVAFAIFFFPIRYLVLDNFILSPIFKSLVAFAIATILAPKFQALNTNDGVKIFMKWIFIKGVKEVK